MKRKLSDTIYAPTWDSVADDVCQIICSFCDLNDLLSLRRTSSFFRRCAREEVRMRHVLNFSAIAAYSLVEKKDSIGNASIRPDIRLDYDENTMFWWIKRDKQQECISTILYEITNPLNDPEEKNEFRRSPYHLDLSNLRGFREMPQIGLFATRSLLVLDLSNCVRLDPQSIIDLTTPNSLQSNHSPPPLKELYLSGCNRIGESCVIAIVQRFTNLKTLHMGLISQTVGDLCISQICCHLKGLESLDVMGLKRITDRGIMNVFRQLDSLKYLNVNGCGRMKWSFLSEHCELFNQWVERRPTEEILNLLNMARLGHTAQLKDILLMNTMDIDIFSMNLVVAKISFGPNIRGGLQRNSLSLLALASFGRLREVDVSGSSYVSDDDVRNLVYTCSDSLRSLEMRCCESINDSSVVAISQFARRLTLLDISACFAISDSGIRSLELPSLTTLKIASLTQVTDKGICSLVSLYNLMVLDVQNCPNISSRAVRTLLQKCQHILELDARNIRDRCMKLSKNEKEKLVIFNGRRCDTKCKKGHRNNCCSVRYSSQRNAPNQGGVKARRMYHCRQCNLLQSHDRGICSSCATTCHKGHVGVYCSSITFFYCDCAFQKSSCMLISNLQV